MKPINEELISKRNVNFDIIRCGPYHMNPVKWIISYGSYHMDHIIWTKSYGPNHMDHIIWTMSYGPYHMDHVIWTKSYGPYNMDHIIWTISYGDHDIKLWPVFHFQFAIDRNLPSLRSRIQKWTNALLNFQIQI